MVPTRRLLLFLQIETKICPWCEAPYKVSLIPNLRRLWSLTSLICAEQLEGLEDEEQGQKDFKDMLTALLQFC